MARELTCCSACEMVMYRGESTKPIKSCTIIVIIVFLIEGVVQPKALTLLNASITFNKYNSNYAYFALRCITATLEWCQG